MNDMRAVIEPKSDQLNADSLLSGPITVTITAVDIRPGTEQPVSVHYDGENGRPYKPCKSMARVMVHAWGPDAKQYIGRSMTLYCDPTVKWAGMDVGGIRISHLSHIDAAMQMNLTATKGQRKAFKVLPLAKKKTVADYKSEIDAMDMAAIVDWQTKNAGFNDETKAGPFSIWQHAVDRAKALASAINDEGI